MNIPVSPPPSIIKETLGQLLNYLSYKHRLDDIFLTETTAEVEDRNKSSNWKFDCEQMKLRLFQPVFAFGK